MMKKFSILGFMFVFLMYAIPGYCVIADGWYKIQVKHTGKIMTVKSGSTADSANIVQYADSNQDYQLWYIEKSKDSNPDTYMIISKKSQKVADIFLAYTLDGAALIQYSSKSGSNKSCNNQLFSFVDLGNGYYNIINKNSGKALHIDAGSTSNDAKVLQWSNNNYEWYKWKLIPVTTSAPAPTTGSQACGTKYPILLLHGVAMNNKLLTFNYFGRVADNLTARGAKVFGGKQDAFGSYTSNAEQIKTQINDYVSRINPATNQPYGKVNIIAHSKGGIDTREMLYLYPDMKSKIASFTTLATPHDGTSLSDWANQTFSGDFLNWAVKVLSLVLGDTGNAASSTIMNRSNMITKNAQWNSRSGYTGILCQSYAAQIITTDILQQLDTMFLVTNWIMGNLVPGTKQPNNDGAVPVDSAKFATFKGTNYLVTAGYGGITHDGISDRGLLVFAGMTPGFDAPNFYRTIVANLKTAGY